MRSKYCAEIYDKLNLHFQAPENNRDWINFSTKYTMCLKNSYNHKTSNLKYSYNLHHVRLHIIMKFHFSLKKKSFVFP